MTNAVDGIREFWAWWPEVQPRILSAIEVERNFSDELVAEISAHVDAIGDIDWELCPGSTAKHAFCLSAKGNPETRLVTEMWKQRGLAADETWEFHPAKQGGRGLALQLEDVDLDLDRLSVAFEVEGARERVSGTYYHPNFEQLPEEALDMATLLLLDLAFGEDGVERWLGGISWSLDPLENGVPFSTFVEEVQKVMSTATGEQFIVMRADGESGPVFVTCNQALKRVDHLLNVMHLAVDLTILDQSEDGLTTQADADALNALEDELQAALGGLAVYFGRVTYAGHRVMHWYVPEDSAAQNIAQRWADANPERSPKVTMERDAGWEFVAQFV